MKRKLLSMVMLLVLTVTPASILIAPAYADCGNPDSAASPTEQVKAGIGETGGDCNGGGVLELTGTIVNILSLIVGVVAIIMIIVGGFKYITSGGESGRVANAKNTLIYALIGLVIAALAQFLVHFVITNTDTAAQGLCPTNRDIKANSRDCKP